MSAMYAFLRGSSSILLLTLCFGVCTVASADPAPAAAAPLAPVELVCVDTEATGYATFQSHNQKMVSNRNGIFMTHLRSRNEAYTAQQWWLSRSTDGGRTFSTLFEDTHATNPPVLETDEADNLYLMRVDFQDGNAYLYRFLAASDYRDPAVTVVPQGAAGKYAMRYDPARKQLYFSPITIRST